MQSVASVAISGTQWHSVALSGTRWPVGDADDEHVVEGVDTVHLGEQLVDDRVSHARGVAAQRAALPRERVELVEDDDVEGRLRAIR